MARERSTTVNCWQILSDNRILLSRRDGGLLRAWTRHPHFPNARVLFLVLAILAVAGSSSALAATGGYADFNGTTTGGEAGSTVTVVTASEFLSFVGSTAPYVIQFQDSFSFTNGFNVRSDKTILGLGTNATINGTIYLDGVKNVIVRNVFITNSEDNNNDGTTDDEDGMTVIRGTHHLWIDHCTFYDCLDGELDITRGSDFITVSSCKFYYTHLVNDPPHNFVNLIGHSDGNASQDTNKLHVTFHHNWWSTLCVERMPRVRFGRIHSYNNFFSPSVNGTITNNYCARAARDSEVRIENNFFERVRNPWEVFITRAGGVTGKIFATGNNVSFLGTSDGVIWGTTATNTANGEITMVVPGTDTVFAVPYTYVLDDPAGLRNTVTNNAGAGRMPVAGFTADPNGGTPPLTVTFTDTSTGFITDRFWDFGDGTTTNTSATSFVHTYTAPGIYSPQLTVSGPAGADTKTRAGYIAACDYNLSALSAVFAFEGGTGMVSVTPTPNPCPWTVISNDPWIEILTGGGVIINDGATILYSVLPYTSSSNTRTGSMTIAGQTFTVTQSGDTEPPAVVLAPLTSAIVSNTMALAATATDNAAVAKVDFYRDGGVLLAADTAPPYSINFNTTTVGDGPHCFYAKAHDAANNVGSSSSNCVIVDNNAPSVPALTATSVSSNQINLSWSASIDPGSGVASYNVFREGSQIATTGGTNYSDHGLAGATEYCYRVAAFDNVGRVSAPSAEACAQTFTKVEAMLGTYNGLFIQTNAPSHATSGSIRFVVSKTASFAAKLTVGGAPVAFAGQFDTSGNATNTVARRSLNPLQVILHLDLAGADQITGSISDGAFTSVLLADRVAYGSANPCPWAGRFAVVLEPPEGDDPSIPQGFGYGTLAVTTAGRGRVTGALADGTKINATVPLSKHGTWPLYDALYKNHGASIGWVTFGTNHTVEATVDWFRPSISTSAYYPDGFTTNVTLIGREYVPPSAYNSPSATPNRQITLGGGNVVNNIVKSVYVYDVGNVVVLSPNNENLKLKLDPATGQFNGSFTHPQLNKTINFKGSALQFDGTWAGYFMGADSSGYVIVEPTR